MLSKRLRQIRKERGLTQEELANKVKTRKTTISNYETGYSTPSNEMLKDLADVLNTTTDFLLGRTDNPEPTKIKIAGQEISLSPEELKLFEELKKHPALFHDLASDPEGKVKELLKLYKMKKILLEDDDEDYGDGFGELDD